MHGEELTLGNGSKTAQEEMEEIFLLFLCIPVKMICWFIFGVGFGVLVLILFLVVCSPISNHSAFYLISPERQICSERDSSPQLRCM